VGRNSTCTEKQSFFLFALADYVNLSPVATRYCNTLLQENNDYRCKTTEAGRQFSRYSGSTSFKQAGFLPVLGWSAFGNAFQRCFLQQLAAIFRKISFSVQVEEIR